MSRLRYENPRFTYFVTNRTLQRQFFFCPNDAFNALVKRRLRLSVRMYNVKLHAAVVMSNHFHLLVTAPHGNLADFMQHFQGQLARALNKILGRKGKMFDDRYDAQPILDDYSLIKKLEYTLTNPVRAGLVRRPGDWPGYTSWHQMVGVVDDEAPPITPLPHLRHLNFDETKEFTDRLVKRTVADNWNRSFLGPSRCKRMNWKRHPRTPEQPLQRKPLCHAKDIETWRRFARFSKHKQIAYRLASRLAAQGEAHKFPYGTYPPGRVRGPDQFEAEAGIDSNWCMARRRATVYYDDAIRGYFSACEEAGMLDFDSATE